MRRANGWWNPAAVETPRIASARTAKKAGRSGRDAWQAATCRRVAYRGYLDACLGGQSIAAAPLTSPAQAITRASQDVRPASRTAQL
jgi:hypothetical protein